MGVKQYLDHRRQEQAYVTRTSAYLDFHSSQRQAHAERTKLLPIKQRRKLGNRVSRAYVLVHTVGAQRARSMIRSREEALSGFGLQ